MQIVLIDDGEEIELNYVNEAGINRGNMTDDELRLAIDMEFKAVMRDPLIRYRPEGSVFLAHQGNYMGRTKNTKDYWETPPYFFNLLQRDLRIRFTVDVAAGGSNYLCTKYYTDLIDGLQQDWKGETAFCNPPFSNLKEWVKKCYEESRKPDTIVVLLCPSRTDTQYWHNYVMKAEGLMFCIGRVNFLLNGEKPYKYVDGKKIRCSGSNFPLAVVLFGMSLRRDLRGVRSFNHKEYKKKYEKLLKSRFTMSDNLDDLDDVGDNLLL